MPFEWLVGTRYLAATRSSGAPSVITVISVSAVAVGVAALIVVLAILGGFEGDLRTKILGTKAHVLVTGQSSSPLVDYEPLVEAIATADGVAGVSPFVESDVMIASATNYSGIVLRGIDPHRVVTTTDMAEYVIEGELEWLTDPEAARQARRAALADDGEFDSLAERVESLRAELDELEERRNELEREHDATEAERRVEAAARLGIAARASAGSGDVGSPAAAVAADDARDAASPASGSAEGSADAGSVERVGPRTLRERMAERAEAGRDGIGPPTRRPGAPRELPGILIGTELRDSLHVDVGDQVQIINPDGDDGPTGPIPRAWPYRVVGVFYTGLYEYDNTMVYMLLPKAREFLRVPDAQVTGVEVRGEDMDAADDVAAAVGTALAAAGRADASVSTWMQLNERLFSALELEQIAVGLILMIIVLVASFAIVCVLIMIVIQRADEIAILRSMGAAARTIQRIFVIQGMSIGVSGTLIGLALGLGIIGYLAQVGYPLDPNVYYIDQVPVELRWAEVLAVVLGAVAISAVATILPSMQAARLDPAAALRHE